jgi:hypothetical protein
MGVQEFSTTEFTSGSTISVVHALGKKMQSIRRASLDPPVGGLSQPLLFSFVVPPGSACMYAAALSYLSDRRGGHNIKLSEV